MGIVATLKSTIESRPGQVVTTLAQMGIAFYSLFSMITALNALVANAGDLDNTVDDNWRSQPFVSIELITIPTTVATGTVSCPSSHPVLLSSMPFRGVSEGLCTCARGASFRDDGLVYEEYSSITACSRNQTRAGCVDDSAIPAFTLDIWDGGIAVCGRRGGEAAVISNSPFKERPTPSGGACPSGYRVCGVGASRICFPMSEPLCPLTRLETVAATAFQPGNVSTGDIGLRLPSGDWLVGRRATSGDLPVTQTTTGFRSVCVGQDHAYRYRQSGASVDGTLSVDTSCQGGRTTDARFQTFMQASQTDLLRRNFEQYDPLCGSANRNDRAMPSFTGTCGSSDAQCDAIAYRTKCEKLTAYSRGDTSAGQARMMFREEIPWSATCPIERRTLVEQASPLAEIVSFATTVTYINVATNVFSILLYVNLLWNLCAGDSPCCPFSHDQEKRLIKGCKTYADTIAKLGRFVPLVLLALATHRVAGFWAEVIKTKCTDDETQATLAFLSTTLDTAYLSYAATAAADALSLLFSVYNVIKSMCCPKVDDLDEEAEKEHSTTAPTAMVSESAAL